MCAQGWPSWAGGGAYPTESSRRLPVDSAIPRTGHSWKAGAVRTRPVQGCGRQAGRCGRGTCADLIRRTKNKEFGYSIGPNSIPGSKLQLSDVFIHCVTPYVCSNIFSPSCSLCHGTSCMGVGVSSGESGATHNRDGGDGNSQASHKLA